MKVHLRQIPEGETLRLEGAEDPSPLGLEEAGASAAGPLSYALDVGLSEGDLFATGRISLPVKFQCVVTLDDFVKEIVVDPFSLQKPLDGRECVDLTPEVREDIHLALPAHPRSDAAESVDRPFVGGASEADPFANSRGNPWEALDKLKIN